jgi:hypothetical protein
MTTYRPLAAAIPPMSALPYPRRLTATTRAPSAAAIVGDPSLLPLSATTTSPAIPAAAIVSSAERTQAPTVSASLRQGITTEHSTGSTASVITIGPAPPPPTRIAPGPPRARAPVGTAC